MVSYRFCKYADTKIVYPGSSNYRSLNLVSSLVGKFMFKECING